MTHNDSTIPVSPLYVKSQMEVLVLAKARWDHCKTANFQCTCPKKWAGIRDILSLTQGFCLGGHLHATQ
jgi:hypothetical protein